MQHRNAKLIFFLCCLLTIGFIGLNEVLTDCLPYCPDFVGGGSCPYGQIIGIWFVAQRLQDRIMSVVVTT
jgi:hypothetical protein